MDLVAFGTIAVGAGMVTVAAVWMWTGSPRWRVGRMARAWRERF